MSSDVTKTIRITESVQQWSEIKTKALNNELSLTISLTKSDLGSTYKTFNDITMFIHLQSLNPTQSYQYLLFTTR